MTHDNLNVFIGACFEYPNNSFLWSYCSKGSLQDVLLDEDSQFDNTFKLSFLIDISKGMDFIHKSHLHSHGNLKSSNCLVDERWSIKVIIRYFIIKF